MMNWVQLLSPARSIEEVQNTSASDNLARTVFEQDFDRIIFSHPFRRLQDKTQVFPLPDKDFVHTRLTHSLEVSSVGRSLGRKAGVAICDRHKELRQQGYSEFDLGAITAAASLAHDLGNPPFGHSGEDAISEFFTTHNAGLSFRDKVSGEEWSDLIKFEGNAQGFRIITRKELGLKLTFATLGAFTKYPRPSLISKTEESRKSQKKFGFYSSEVNEFENIAKTLGLIRSDAQIWRRHPLAFLVEAADDICYQIIDLEDGCRLGLVSYENTEELLAKILGNKIDKAKLNRKATIEEKVGTLRALTIGTLIDQCSECFLDNESKILEGDFDTALTKQIPSASALETIADLSIETIYKSQVVIEIEVAGFEVLPGLLDAFTSAAWSQNHHQNFTQKHKAILRLLPGDITAALSNSGKDTYTILRNILDFVSGLTDKHALNLFRQIKGISLPKFG